jgi:hypothetical protein
MVDPLFRTAKTAKRNLIGGDKRATEQPLSGYQIQHGGPDKTRRMLPMIGGLKYVVRQYPSRSRI